MPTLLAMAPAHFDRYVEPFAGSACLFFSLTPKKALLADINKELIDCYLELRDNVEALITHLGKMRISKSRYYALRSLDPAKLPNLDRAARFIYLNRLCFNGLYRTNRQGRFNVPFGGGRCGALPSPERLRDCSLALKRAQIRATTFEKTLSKVKSGDFVYLDPPYCIASRRVFNEYSNASFDQEQVRTLRRSLDELNKKGVPFLVSYGFSQEAQFLGKGFNVRHTLVQRQIAGFTASRKKARELVITNY